MYHFVSNKLTNAELYMSRKNKVGKKTTHEKDSKGIATHS